MHRKPLGIISGKLKKKRKNETLPVVSLNCIPTLFPGKITLECKLLFEVSHISPPAEDYAALRNSSRITDVAAENLRPLSRPLFLIPSTFSLSEALTGCVSKGICNFTGANLI